MSQSSICSILTNSLFLRIGYMVLVLLSPIILLFLKISSVQNFCCIISMFSVCRLETLKRHLPNSGPEDLNQLRNIGARFEERIFTQADNQVHFIRLTSNSVVLNYYSVSDFTRMALPSNRCMFN